MKKTQKDRLIEEIVTDAHSLTRKHAPELQPLFLEESIQEIQGCHHLFCFEANQLFLDQWSSFYILLLRRCEQDETIVDMLSIYI